MKGSDKPTKKRARVNINYRSLQWELWGENGRLDIGDDGGFDRIFAAISEAEKLGYEVVIQDPLYLCHSVPCYSSNDVDYTLAKVFEYAGWQRRRLEFHQKLNKIVFVILLYLFFAILVGSVVLISRWAFGLDTNPLQILRYLYG